MAEQQFPKQHQNKQPGERSEMDPKPKTLNPDYKGSGKLKGEGALITGGDSGIGRAVALAFAREGADISIIYLEEDEDAAETKRLVEKQGSRCIVIPGDVGEERFARKAVDRVIDEFGRLDVLVNNAAEQHPKKSIADIDADQIERTFRTNVFAMFYFVKAALDELKKRKGRIINTTSVTAYRGSPGLLDYSASKGAVTAFTRSLSGNLVDDGIRVNAVAPGPIWTPLIPSTFDEEKVASFGGDTPMERAGQPFEVAPAFVYLASNDSSYVTGQVIHVNGGEIING